MSEPVHEVVWPLGRTVPAVEEIADRLPDLSGKVVAELWDWLYGGDRAFPIVRRELERRFPGIRFVGYETFGNTMLGTSVTEQLPLLFEEYGVDCVISAVGHCGSCTPATIRAAVVAEAAGVPSVSIVGSLFVPLATATARFLGIEGLPLAVYPGRIPVDAQAEFERKVATTIVDQVVHGLTGPKPSIAPLPPEPAPREVVFTGTLDDVLETFHENLWTDGLPVVPPTRDRVEALLSYTDREPDERLGVLLPERREATVWNVAVNGVMAGCRPEYMPVLLASVESIADRDFQLETAGGGIGWEPLIVVSGPIVEELGFNAGAGAMRVGRQANSSIGRFLRLYMRNVAGFRIPPSTSDRTGIGTSFNVVLAEDGETTEALGWPTFGEDRGAARGESTVTVQSVLAESPPFGEYGCSPDDPESYLRPIAEVFGKAICGYWLFVGLVFARWHPIVLLSPHVAKVLDANGWDKDDVRRFLYENSMIPARTVEHMGKYVNLDIPAQVASGKLPATYHESDDPDRLIPTFLRPEWIQIIISGSADMYYQRAYMNYHAHGAPVTRIVPARTLTPVGGS